MAYGHPTRKRNLFGKNDVFFFFYTPVKPKTFSYCQNRIRPESFRSTGRRSPSPLCENTNRSSFDILVIHFRRKRQHFHRVTFLLCTRLTSDVPRRLQCPDDICRARSRGRSEHVIQLVPFELPNAIRVNGFENSYQSVADEEHGTSRSPFSPTTIMVFLWASLMYWKINSDHFFVIAFKMLRKTSPSASKNKSTVFTSNSHSHLSIRNAECITNTIWNI